MGASKGEACPVSSHSIPFKLNNKQNADLHGGAGDADVRDSNNMTCNFLYPTGQWMAELTKAERTKIQNYVTTIMEGVDTTEVSLVCCPTRLGRLIVCNY